MRTTLLRALAALLCLQAVCADLMPVKGYNQKAAAGKWYKIAIATNGHWLVDHKAGLKMGTLIDTPTAGGDAIVSYATLNADGTCKRTTITIEKTDTPGRYTFRSPHWSFEMRVVDVQYGDFAVVYNLITHKGVTLIDFALFSRTPKVSTAVKKRYRKFCLDTGILPDNIVFLPNKGECPDV